MYERAKRPGSARLRLSGPSALINELRVPASRKDGWPRCPTHARASKGSPVTTADARQESNAASNGFRLPADQPLVLNLVNAQERKPAPPPVPSVWQMDAQALVRYDEGQLAYKARLRLSTDAGTGTTADLLLPAATNVLSVSGADLDSWRVVKSAGRGTRRQWKSSGRLRTSCGAKCCSPTKFPSQPPRATGIWTLRRSASNGGRLRSALYVLPMIEGVEFVSDEGGTPLPAGDRATTSALAGGRPRGRQLSVVNQDKPAPADNASTLVRVRRLPLVRTVRATVEQSRFRTRLVADGALLSEGTVTVRHDGPQTVELTLPKEAQLLSCSVKAHDALPVDRGGGPHRPDAARRSRRKTHAGRPVLHGPPARPGAGGGSDRALALPETNLFVQTLLWELQIPEGYELTALEGNVALAPAVTAPAANGPPMIRLRKDLLKGEQPNAELFYQKRAVAP